MTQGTRTILASTVFLAMLAGSSSAGNPDPKQMVLRLQDLPTGFASSSGTGYKLVAAAAAESTSTTVAQYKAWGYVIAYEADFTKSGGLGDLLSGASAVLSTVTVYSSSSGATKSLASAVASCHKSPSNELSVGAKIGDEAHLCSTTKKTGKMTARAYAMFWRHGRFKAVVLVGGFAGTTSPTLAVSLAEIQDKRMG